MVPLARGKGAAEEAAAEEAEEDAMPERKRLRRLTVIVIVMGIDRMTVIVMVIDRMTLIDRMMVNDWMMVIMIVIMMAIHCDCDKIL